MRGRYWSVDSQWRITEHTASVAAAFADRWATAAVARARRIEHPRLHPGRQSVTLSKIASRGVINSHGDSPAEKMASQALHQADGDSRTANG